MAARSGPGSATAIAAEDPAALAEALRPYLVDDALAVTAQTDVASLLERMAGPAGFAERRLALYRAAIGD
jgi:hypothetical protein